MPLDPVLAKEVSTWLVKATEDLRAAQVDLKAEPPLLNDSLFHCQQACEKALKALLCCLQTPFRKVHDLNELGNLAMQSFPELDPSLEKIAHLSGYAVTSRYPSDEPDPEADEAHANYQIAFEFASEIKQLIQSSSAI
jgi:HEPN domain-containing protein